MSHSVFNLNTITETIEASHSVYAFSSSHRWMNCPASIRMSKGYFNKTNPQAEKGTAAHELGEFCIKIGMQPKHCMGLVFNNITVDQQIIDGSTLYKNTVDLMTLNYGVQPLLEERVVMSSLGRQDVYGTSDVTHIALDQRVLHTTDYKNGYGVVDVNNNSQTAGYSVATLDTFDLWDKVDEVHNTIIQLNYNHIEGAVRTVKYTMSEMREWQEKYRIAVSRADDVNEKPVAGSWCHYCPAQANCRARMVDVLDKSYTDTPLENISIGELEVLFKNIGSVKKFLDMVEARMNEEACNGVEFKDFKLVKSLPRAKVHDVEGLLAYVKQAGLPVEKLYNNPTIIGKTKAKQFLNNDTVNEFWKVPEPSNVLVPNSDRRPALRLGKTAGVFTAIEQPKQTFSQFSKIN